MARVASCLAASSGRPPTIELVREILRDNQFVKAQADDRNLPLKFRMIERRADPTLPHPLAPPSMLSVNPPAHTRYRTLVSKAFTPRAIELLRPRIEELADEMLSAAAVNDEFDLIADYAGLLPVAVIGEVLGIPMTDRGYFRTLGARLARMIDLAVGLSDYTDAMAALRELDRFFDQHLARIRKDPGEDMLSKLVQVEVDGDRLTDHELKTAAILLLVAGFETTVNLIGNGLVLLLTNPDELAKLRDDGSLWPNAVEEMLRYESPVQYTGRISSTAVDVDGVHIPKHRLIALLIGGANHDPDVFPTLTGSMSRVPMRVSTSRSQQASTSASAPASLGWRDKSACRRSSNASRT